MTKRVIVTGASSGIGRETALLLAAQGHEIVLSARREHLLRELAEQCGPRAHVFACDVCEESQTLIDFARNLGSGVEPVLVNAAGIAEFGDFTKLEFQGQLNVNLSAPMALCQAAIPWMLSHGSGQIVNVLSIAATTTFAGAAAYAASKAGLLTAGRCLSAEYRKQGIRITSILPGATDTPIWDGAPFVPERADMLTALAVADAICWVINLPADRVIDELTITPPKGIL